MCFLELVAKVSRVRKGSTLFKRDKARERERSGGEIGKHGSNSEKRSRNRDEEVVEEEGVGSRERVRGIDKMEKDRRG